MLLAFYDVRGIWESYPATLIDITQLGPYILIKSLVNCLISNLHMHLVFKMTSVMRTSLKELRGTILK